MNILLIDSVDLPFGGAHSVHVSLVIKGLRENRENAFLIVPYGNKHEILSSNKKKYGHYDGIPYCFVRKHGNSKKLFQFFDTIIGVLNTALFIYRRKKKKKIDAVILGDNTVIGANSVVTKNIPSNVIAAGNPCNVIKEIQYT